MSVPSADPATMLVYRLSVASGRALPPAHLLTCGIWKLQLMNSDTILAVVTRMITRRPSTSASLASQATQRPSVNLAAARWAQWPVPTHAVSRGL